MIKQIQLRGISRTPSDRLTADGGCAESLNVHLADNELSPTLAPEDVTEELGLPTDATKDFIYIHKGNGYTNYITLDGREFGAYVGGVYDAIASMAQGEEFKSITSIGNTLVIMGSAHPYYALFKDNRYIFLGSQIPLPTIRLTPELVEEIEYTDEQLGKLEKLHWRTFYKMGNDDSEYHPSDPRPNHYFNHLSPDPALEGLTIDYWNDKANEAEAKKERYAGREILEEDEWDLMTGMKEYAELAEQIAKNNKFLYNQVMAMYGVRLYNDSYITSVPILMPGGFECPYSCRYLRHKRSTDWNREAIDYRIRYPYKIKAKIEDFNEETMRLWSDIILSVDFFMTANIRYDVTEENVAYAVKEISPSVYTTEQYEYESETYNMEAYNYFEIVPGSKEYRENYIKRILDIGSDGFYRVQMLSTDENDEHSMEKIAQFRVGALLDIDDCIANQDFLRTQKALADCSYNMRASEIVGEIASSINNRVLLAGVAETLSSGEQFFPAAPCYLVGENTGAYPNIEESHKFDLAETKISFSMYSGHNQEATYSRFKSDFAMPDSLKYLQIVYHIKGFESYTIRGRIGEDGGFIDEADNNLGYFGFLLFPDQRCTAVDIYLSYDNETWYMKSYEMREHPNLNCSYMYIGVDKNLLWDIGHIEMSYEDAVPTYENNGEDATEANVSDIEESRIEERSNILLLSDVDNPWFFPLENEYQMQATEIIGTALATKALSTGQFGQFPLYVFTDNGIWAMQMNAYGTFSSAHAVSMEVAKKGAILSLDQAVVFLTDKGVMLLTGSDIQNLSPNMNGKHYIVENSAAALINGSIWNPLMDALVDGSHFMSFMESATPVYDYAGERIIFFNKERTYMYVYMIKTATWHKMMLPEGTHFSRLLNSYPQTYISVDYTGYARILDFSTALDVTSGDNIRAVIVTRPMDLGEPDIRKTIKSIRIRGQYNRNDVKYILLGSMDGLNWGVLPSLRGGSYKWYKMIILAYLSPTERISWIDIDYESRFANKLR